MWSAFENNSTLGTRGSENGYILKDEGQEDGARITLEEGGYHPFAITCGIYGAFVHTAFASALQEAEAKYEAMKLGLSGLLAEKNNDAFLKGIEHFVDAF